jgi:regulator of protease activity HflC (stomatin/prohibitin superfamily)
VSDDIRDDVDTSVDESVDSSVDSSVKSSVGSTSETSADTLVDSSHVRSMDDAWSESLEAAPSARTTDEGLLIALTAIRMAVKNRIIVGALRDQKQYLPESYVDVAREEIASLALQNDVLAARLEDQARTRAKRLADRAALVAENNARTAERDARAAERAARLTAEKERMRAERDRVLAEKEAKAAARGGKRGVKLARRPRTSAPAVLDGAAASSTDPQSANPSPTTEPPVDAPAASTPDGPITPPTAAEQTQLAESQRSEMLRRVYTTLAADLRCVAHNSERLAELVESARQDAWQEIRGAWHVKLAAQSPVEVGPDYDRHREGRLLELIYIDLAALRHDAKRRPRKTK